MEYIYLLILPIIGVLWFLNLASFLKNLHRNESTHNQTMIGALLTFLFVFLYMYGFLGAH
ncbi:hypothetical protein ETC03_02405 [Geobacillus sp. MMMUD3]|uniref:Uncharacterized protein n=1 Tax=Geobacillus subterraneus TaxID=129338 RepID=A0A679FPC6_9BACL|nr:hypothetical protein [Geobacillus sp. MMMUD3]TWG31130.1 hypothetical protein GC56T2_2339 [Geobacillus sp. C56-T2]BBW95676.1 hypothetical protein GsuE55_05090 [Geobacillus subterraneus]